MVFPILHYKTPLEEKKIKYDGKFYLVNTRVEICIYKIKEENGTFQKEKTGEARFDLRVIAG